MSAPRHSGPPVAAGRHQSDLTGLADAILRMASVEEERLVMGKTAKKRAELYYQYDQMIDQYRQMYKEYVK